MKHHPSSTGAADWRPTVAADLPEADWRAFKKVREVALERLCERILNGIERIAADSGSFHARYLRVYEFIQQRDADVARAFNSPRRSTTVIHLAEMASLGLVTNEELAVFSARTRAIVAELSKPAG